MTVRGKKLNKPEVQSNKTWEISLLDNYIKSTTIY